MTLHRTPRGGPGNARHGALVAAVVLAAAAAACTGSLGPADGADLGHGAGPGGEGSAGSTGAAGGPGVGPQGDPACAAPHPGASPLRRLTRDEYNNTVRDLLGDTSDPASHFPGDSDQNGFANDAASSTVSQLGVEAMRDAAEALALSAVADVKKLTGCDAVAKGEDVCAQAFVVGFGKRAFRRPVTDEEKTRLLAVYKAGKALGDHTTGVRLTLQVILQSSPFLYRIELGQPVAAGDAVQKLTPHEVASRLSYLIWGSMPDDQLFAAADAGALTTPAKIADQARRLLKDDRAKSAVETFHLQWLGLTGLDKLQKDKAKYPVFTDAARAAIGEGTRRFIDDVVFKGDAKVSTLLTAPYAFVNADLAPIYGVPVTGADFVKTQLDPTRQSGLLTQPTLLAKYGKFNSSSPVLRGKLIRERLFCTPLPPPPMNVPPPPEVKPGVSTRERFKEHSTNPACSGCHSQMDPIGFGFEHFDAIGAWRDTDADQPVDASGNLTGTDVDGAFDGPVELGKKLVKSTQVGDCVATHWFRYAAGRHETDEDSCSVALLKKTYAATSGDVRELMVALTQTDAFLYRPKGPTP